MSYAAYSLSGISKTVYDLSEQVMQAVLPAFGRLEKIKEINQLRVIRAMQEAGVSESMFGGSTGYGMMTVDAVRSNVHMLCFRRRICICQNSNQRRHAGPFTMSVRAAQTGR